MLDRPSPITETWTEERIETLKTLWLAGKSAGDIAFALGNDISRSAVIGKVHRLKLRREAPARTPGKGTVKRSAKDLGNDQRVLNKTVKAARGSAMSGQAFAIARARTRAAAGETVTVADLLTKTTVELEPTGPEPFSPEDQRLSLVHLTEHTCKWPIGDPRSPDFSFCGQPSEEGTPYCEFHSRRAYHQIEKQKR